MNNLYSQFKELTQSEPEPEQAPESEPETEPEPESENENEPEPFAENYGDDDEDEEEEEEDEGFTVTENFSCLGLDLENMSLPKKILLGVVVAIVVLALLKRLAPGLFNTVTAPLPQLRNVIPGEGQANFVLSLDFGNYTE